MTATARSWYYLDGDAFRYADDILITCRSKDRAEQILGIVTEFLAVRGLGVNHEKTHIANAFAALTFSRGIIAGA